MPDFLISVIIFCVLIGTFTISFAIEFDSDEPQGFVVDWPKALIGTALLLVAAVTAAVQWPA